MDATTTEPALADQDEQPSRLTVAEFLAYAKAAFAVTDLDLPEQS